MRKFFITFFLNIIVLFSVYGQQIDYAKIIVDENNINDDIREKLVQLAWKNHPMNQLIIKDYEIAKITLTQTRWSWLDQFGVQGNINEFTINPNPDINLFYPRYNFGVTIPLGILVTLPTSTKVANKELEKADLEIKQQMLITRNQVLKAYQNYLMYEQIYTLRSNIAEEEYANFLIIEEEFENGEVTLEKYREANNGYILELEKRINAKNQLENAKLDLEMLIGVKFEDVI